jgi:hypothetical protein
LEIVANQKRLVIANVLQTLAHLSLVALRNDSLTLAIPAADLSGSQWPVQADYLKIV